MCGIIGIIAQGKNVVDSAVEGLRRLEYRGYDSAGVAAVDKDGNLRCVRHGGKIAGLRAAIDADASPPEGEVCIGHTRWATHGPATVINAHPHCRTRVAVVHNGIIENFDRLRQDLQSKGYEFETETDTEVVPVLLSYYLDQGYAPQQAVTAMLGDIEGAFALGILFKDEPHRIYAAKLGSPLAVGYGKDCMYVASDAQALGPYTNRVAYLEEGDFAVVDARGARIFDRNGVEAIRPITLSNATGKEASKENFEHFMLKEIHEQPTAISETIHDFYNPVRRRLHFEALEREAKNIHHITIVACGTSYYAGMVARYWLEQVAKIPSSIDVASEFRYGGRLLPEQGGMALCISQSGETADTLAALRYAKQMRQTVVSLVNVEQSSMARESDVVLHTRAGPEIGVASTKAFTTQLVALAGVALDLAKMRGAIADADYKDAAGHLMDLPSAALSALNLEEEVKRIAALCANARDIFYVGRGVSFPVAMEGALKMKEISYIHAEGFAAGELKHGPIALIEKGTPVIAVAPADALFDKTLSNVQEVKARGGTIVAVTDDVGAERLKGLADHMITLRRAHPMLSPVMTSVPLQLLAYHVALLKGADIDKPRNLAKSVTVE
ncbi:MAG: glutamine--fructose-6-phosphate transaminase (isomerizing) [Rickettsiales bacterium]